MRDFNKVLYAIILVCAIFVFSYYVLLGSFMGAR